MKPARGRSQRDSHAEGIGRATRRGQREPRQPEQESAEHYDEHWDDQPQENSREGSWYAEATRAAGRRLSRRGTTPPPPPTEPEDAEWTPIEGEWHPEANEWEADEYAAPPDGTSYDDGDPDQAMDAEPVPADSAYAEPYPEPAPMNTLTGYAPPVWSLAGYAWRFGKKLTIPRINQLLRFGLHRIIPQSTQARFVAMGIPHEIVDFTLKQVRNVDDWAEAWTGTAQRFLSETRRGGNMLSPTEAARARQRAAMCYHVAPFFALGDERLARASRSSATTLFNQSVGLVMPDTRRVDVRWRAKSMPGYLTLPSDVEGQVPLVVLLNGLTTTKEEMVLWQDAYLQQNMAVLALDWPGTGEATPLGPIRPEFDDIADGLFELVEDEPNLNRDQVVLVGVSLGAAVAIRAAAKDRRIAAVVAVTPPYEPWMWLGAANELVLAQVAMACGGYDNLARYAIDLNLPAAVQRLRVPLLVLGAGRDLVIPPAEASRMAEAAGDTATLIWYEHAGHALFDALPTWTEDVAGWIAMLFGMVEEPAPLGADDAPDVQTTYEDHGFDQYEQFEQPDDSIQRERPNLAPPPSGTDFGPLSPAAARILAEERSPHWLPPNEDANWDDAENQSQPVETASDEVAAEVPASEEPSRTEREDDVREGAPQATDIPSDVASDSTDPEEPHEEAQQVREPETPPSGEPVEVLPDLPDEPPSGVQATGAFAGGRMRAPQTDELDDDLDNDDPAFDPHAPYRPPRRSER